MTACLVNFTAIFNYYDQSQHWDVDSATSQSEYEAIPCNRLQAREILYEQDAVVLVWNAWESGASFAKQSQSEVNKTKVKRSPFYRHLKPNPCVKTLQPWYSQSSSVSPLTWYSATVVNDLVKAIRWFNRFILVTPDSRYPSRSPELRMKLGEALVKATRNCGELVPRFSQHLFTSPADWSERSWALGTGQAVSPILVTCVSCWGSLSARLRMRFVLQENFQGVLFNPYTRQYLSYSCAMSVFTSLALL